MVKAKGAQPPLESREFRSADEIDAGIAKLERRIRQLEALDVKSAVLQSTGADDAAESDVVDTIRAVFGPNSPEFSEHRHITLWAGPVFISMSPLQLIQGMELGRSRVIGVLNGLIERLKERREDLPSSSAPCTFAGSFDAARLHPRIESVSRKLFTDGHHWPAVFDASKALVNYVKERSGHSELDGAPLIRTVFSPKNPVLAFNNLADVTDQDEQEGMMHLYEGAVLAIRNPGGHIFPTGSGERAFEYIRLLSLLAYRLEETTLRKPKP